MGNGRIATATSALNRSPTCRGYVYLLSDNGIVGCLDAETGEEGRQVARGSGTFMRGKTTLTAEVGYG